MGATRGYIISFVVLAPILSIQAASASKCVFSGPRYWLTSDTVAWSMKIGSGQSCVGDLRFYNVTIESAKIVSPPHTGQVVLLAPTLSYVARSEYPVKDSFTVAITGTISRSRTRGSSTIRVIVTTDASAPRVPSSHDRNPSRVTPTTPQFAVPTDDESGKPNGRLLPPCPTWDWSKGAPPPMRPPFDRSKLYCPPPPFKPPNPPLGCTCR